ncbi:hypothetical protein AG0111_0g3561 [Alternaria gaisen]|uniref:Uncharacterized protein n=1 Tax=Alternaria gaisen TaxID=167740 RepID=A0ACB6FXP8_9PLEO|nr:hypothetical protein AG0111_0g3561 [Alternaria gaisen]
MKLAAAVALMLFARSIMGKGCPDGQIGVGTVQTCLIVNNMQTQCSATQGVVFGEGNCDQADIENMFQKDGYWSSNPGFTTSCVGSGGLGVGVEDVDNDDDDVDDDSSSVVDVVVEAVSLLVDKASVEVSVRVGEVAEETGSVVDTDALVVISLDAEDVSEETTGEEEDDELTASGVTVGSDETDMILLDISAELYDVDDISVVDDEDDVGSTEEVTMTNDALCWVEEGAALEEDTALQSPNPFWQVSGAQ